MSRKLYAFIAIAATVVVIVVVLLVLFLVILKKDDLPPSCESLIYCQGKLLHTIQMAKLDEDSKTFVDKLMKYDVETTLNSFDKMMEDAGQNPTRERLQKFVDDYFTTEGELDEWIPEDLVEDPPFLAKIENEEIKNFAKELVAIWPNLGRKVKAEVAQKPDQHSLIYVPNGFIVPGGRFQEYYYWDSYWIMQGLLVTGMTNTVKGMINNFLSIVNGYGIIPNGGRVYYLRRSQPPLLSFMAKRYYEETQDITWLKESIDTLEADAKFWEKRMSDFKIDGKTYRIVTHNAISAGPRPESYWEDVNAAGIYQDEGDKDKLYIELKSAAESGWDFSSRWVVDENGGTNANISYTKTTRMIPVDINSFLYGAYMNLAYLYSVLDNTSRADYWSTKATGLNNTINSILWNEEDGIWYDYDMDWKQHRKYFAASNLAPLWTNAYNLQGNTTALIKRVVSYLTRNGITEFEGGIPCTLDNSGEQWDMPYAWAPLQAIIVNGLEESGVEEGKYWARIFAERWVKVNMIGLHEHGGMFEKYDSLNPGQYGGGGEYEVQIGFGWTNGVALEFIKKYYTVD